MLNALRAQLDRDYGDFSKPRHANVTTNFNIDSMLRDFMFARFAPFFPSAFQGSPTGTALTIGLQNAYETTLTAQYFAHQTILNPAGHGLEALLTANTAHIDITFGAPTRVAEYGKFDAIFSLHTFNFFEQPEAVLAAAYTALNPGGKLFIAVQNATAGTRQMALAMKLIDNISSIPAPLRQAGQIHFFDRASLRALVQQVGFKELDSGGVMLKTVTDAQMSCLMAQNLVAEPYIRALDGLGKQYPDLCTSVYVVAEKG